MGTELLFTDVSDALELLIKQLKGRQLTKRERKKMKRTLGDIATLVPITILMLIPVRINYIKQQIFVPSAQSLYSLLNELVFWSTSCSLC